MLTFHSFSNDYYRYTHEGIKQLFCGYLAEQKGVFSGLLCRLLSNTADIVFFPFSGKTAFAARSITLALISSLKHLDYYCNKSLSAIRQAVTNYCVLQKISSIRENKHAGN